MEESNFQPVVASTRIDPGLLWDHQAREIEHALEPGWALLWDPRVGKTRATLAQVRVWFNTGRVNRILVSAPKTVCGTVWEPECAQAFPPYPTITGKRNVQVVDLHSGTLNARRSALRQLIYGKYKNIPTIVVVNRDALGPLQEELGLWGPEGLILDELHDYKTPSSIRHLAARRMAKLARFRRGLTGTPTPKNYVDLYGEYKIIAPHVFGTNMRDFQERYCVYRPGKNYQELIAYQNVDELREKMLSVATIKSKEECFDVPKKREITVKVNLPPKARKVYNEIVKKHVYEHQDGKLLSLDHTLARLTVLQQLAGGWNPIEERWEHDALLDAAVEQVEDIVGSNQRVVVFHRFIPEGEHLLKAIGATRAAWIHGGTPDKERTRLIDSFNTPANALGEFSHPQVLIIQESVGSVGISLAGSDYVVFYSCGTNYATHYQARERTFKSKLNDEHRLVYIYLQARKTCHAWVRKIVTDHHASSEELLRPGGFEQAALGEDEED